MSDTFDKGSFKQQIGTQWLGHKLQYFKSLESTNTYAKEISAADITHGMVCLADHQTQGRGQYEREWETLPAQNLTFSLILTPPTAARLHLLTMACAYAVVQSINEQLANNKTCLKWPNDVLYQHKKMAGLLTETVFLGNRLDRLIVGIGLNVNQQKFSPELSNKATSIRNEKGKAVNRELLLGDLLKRIEYNYQLWEQADEMLCKNINQRIIGYGQWVKLKVDNRLWDGRYKMLGINEAGALLMLDEDQQVKTFSHEQVRVVTD